MYRSMLCAVALAALLSPVFACSSSAPEEDDDATEAAEAAQSAGEDVSAGYVGAYATAPSAPAGEISALRLATSGRYALTRKGAAEEGSYKVIKLSSRVELRLTPSSGARRTYKASLGDGLRPLLALTRSGRTSVLQREPTSCAGVTCNPGYACAVESFEGVPRPVCNPSAPPTPAWKSALGGFDRWGVSFSAVLPPVSYLGARKAVSCIITPANDTIACGTTGYDALYVNAAIGSDGAFSSSVGNPNQSGGELRGRVGANGAVTLERFRRTECFQTSSYWCESQETDGQNIPATQTAFMLCRTPDVTFPNGDWVAGYYKACSDCHGDCEGGR